MLWLVILIAVLLLGIAVLCWEIHHKAHEILTLMRAVVARDNQEKLDHPRPDELAELLRKIERHTARAVREKYEFDEEDRKYPPL